MRDFKCVACKIRVRSAGDSADVVGEACPGCGSPLEPVSERHEVLGFRLVAADPVGDYAQRVSAAMAVSDEGTTDAL